MGRRIAKGERTTFWRYLNEKFTYGEMTPHQRDFMADALRDHAAFPKRCASWSELHAYLKDHEACCEALAAGKELWNAYFENHFGRRPRP